MHQVTVSVGRNAPDLGCDVLEGLVLLRQCKSIWFLALPSVIFFFPLMSILAFEVVSRPLVAVQVQEAKVIHLWLSNCW